ncbi:MAG: hypothetical protein ACFFCS_24660 [Candidatus Hodarchaeota archaeon]
MESSNRKKKKEQKDEGNFFVIKEGTGVLPDDEKNIDFVLWGTGSQIDDEQLVDKAEIYVLPPNPSGTGYENLIANTKVIEYPFDKYILKIELSEKNEFLRVLEIKINKDFRTIKEKILHSDDFDAMQYYLDEQLE